MIKLEGNYPATIEDAILELKLDLTNRTLIHIQQTTEDKLEMYHFGIGTTIRNLLGLADGSNKKLIEDCGPDNADDACGFIIWKLWKELQGK